MQDPNQIDCTQASEMLGAFRDMELELSEVATVEAHLATCPMCRQELAAIEIVVASLKSLPELPVKDFADAIEARINERSSLEKASSEKHSTKQPNPESLGPDKLRPDGLRPDSIASQSNKPALAVAQDNVLTFAPPSRRLSVGTMVAVAALLLLGFAATFTLVAKPPTEVAQAPIVNTTPAQFPDKRLDAEKAGAPLSDDIVALYDEEGANNVSDAGISTNEDGLYAIKL